MERVLSASEFKAKCLSCLKEIELSRESITITRRGRPVAILGPTPKRSPKSLRDKWKGKIRIVGDIINMDWHWDAVEDPESVINPESRRSKR